MRRGCVRIEAGVLGLRRDPRLLKLPPYLSALCIIIGVAWLLLLPLNEYSRQTYVSENALLPGQVHTYFGGSEHNVFRAYRQEVARLAEQPDQDRYQGLFDILKSNGLKAGIQDYRYESAGQVRTGRNIYAVLQGPRADATEAMVLMAGWRNMDKVVNYSGVALVLTLARYFKRWSLWSKDIIILLPSDSTFGPQAWVDAYHDMHDPRFVSSLEIKSGALQAAVAIDYPAGPWGHRFDKLHVVYDGINGQLPNLDLLNTAISVASGQMGIGCSIQRMFNTQDRYQDRLETMFRGMISQAWGHASGPHSSFIPYHIDAITLQTVGDGWHDEMSLGRSVEGLFRSLNNLLEHLHQSFFFYLLMNANRFVSIGTYLPSAMLVAGNFTITAILLWIQSGRPTIPVPNPASSEKDKEEPDRCGERYVPAHCHGPEHAPSGPIAILQLQQYLRGYQNKRTLATDGIHGDGSDQCRKCLTTSLQRDEAAHHPDPLLLAAVPRSGSVYIGNSQLLPESCYWDTCGSVVLYQARFRPGYEDAWWPFAGGFLAGSPAVCGKRRS
ncbi:Glycosyl phosphatidyl inositol protein transamidase complex subunit [Zalaria obscura]|uniref:Glycosyl phosphatidyl inositol protein transamidase complex subunit n=1 Tax=Zalaria obscura TaxID=2024903 RepID=A0ACC3SP28_9PEZI